MYKKVLVGFIAMLLAYTSVPVTSYAGVHGRYTCSCRYFDPTGFSGEGRLSFFSFGNAA